MVCGNRFSGYLNLKGLNGVFYLGNRVIAFTHNFLNGVSLARSVNRVAFSSCRAFLKIGK